MSKDDEDTAIAFAKASAEQDLIKATRAYEDAQRAGNAYEAGIALRQASLAANQVAQFKDLEQQQSPQPQFTAREQAWLNQRPSLMQNPAKVQHVQASGAAANGPRVSARQRQFLLSLKS